MGVGVKTENQIPFRYGQFSPCMYFLLTNPLKHINLYMLDVAPNTPTPLLPLTPNVKNVPRSLYSGDIAINAYL